MSSYIEKGCKNHVAFDIKVLIKQVLNSLAVIESE